MQDEVTIWRLIIVPLRVLNSSDVWEQQSCRSWRVNNRHSVILILAGNTWKMRLQTKQATNESKHQTHWHLPSKLTNVHWQNVFYHVWNKIHRHVSATFATIIRVLHKNTGLHNNCPSFSSVSCCVSANCNMWWSNFYQYSFLVLLRTYLHTPWSRVLLDKLTGLS